MARYNQGYYSPPDNYDDDIINVSQESHAKSFKSFKRPQLSHQDKLARENFKTLKKLETKKWNVFEETGDNDKSVSERKYDRSLLKKYKILKVDKRSSSSLFINICYALPGFYHDHHLLFDFSSRSCSQRSNFLHGQPNRSKCLSKSLCQ